MESCRRHGKVLGKPHMNTGTTQLVLELRIGMNGQIHVPAALPRRKNPGNYWTGDWVDSTAGRDLLEKIQILCPYQDSNPGPSSKYPSHQASSTQERRVQNVLLREFYGHIPPALPDRWPKWPRGVVRTAVLLDLPLEYRRQEFWRLCGRSVHTAHLCTQQHGELDLEATAWLPPRGRSLLEKLTLPQLAK